MKKKIAGLILLVIIMGAIGGIYLFTESRNEAGTPGLISVSGYIGGGKKELLEEEEGQDILQKRYHLKTGYSKQGSLGMMNGDPDGQK